MDDALFADERLYDYLLVLDRELAERARRAGCPRCQGRLHGASYPRKPRGGPRRFGGREGYTRRLSLCCACCRKRVTPPSVRFLGRRVYYGAVLVLACVRPLSGARLDELEALLGVDRRTLRRWRRWWRESLVRSPWWRAVRARFMPPLEAQRLPGALLERFETCDPLRRLLEVLIFLAPLSVTPGRAG
jgi:hypothetical protein